MKCHTGGASRGEGWESELWISRDNSTFMSDLVRPGTFLSFQDRRLVVCLPLTSSSSASWKILYYFSNKYFISSLNLFVVCFSYILVSPFTTFIKLIVFKMIKTNFRNSLFTNSPYLSSHSFVLIMKEINIFIPIPKLKMSIIFTEIKSMS